MAPARVRCTLGRTQTRGMASFRRQSPGLRIPISTKRSTKTKTKTENAPNRHPKALDRNRSIKENRRARKRQLRHGMERGVPVLRLRRAQGEEVQPERRDAP